MKKLLLALLITPLLALAGWFGFGGQAPTFGGGDGTITQLQQFVGTTSPSSAITQATFGKAFRLSGQSTGCAQFDSNGILTSTGVTCGTGSGGGGGAGTSTNPFMATYIIATSTTATSTLPNLQFTNLNFNGEYLTDITGKGLTIEDGALTATGTMQVINVKDAPYNAVGDGVTDDTVALAAAYAVQQNASTTACLFLPPGEYLTSVGFNGTEKQCIIGTWSGVNSQRTDPYKFVSRVIMTSNNTPIVTVDSDGDRLENFAMKYQTRQGLSDTNAKALLFLSGATRGRFRNLAFENVGWGMYTSGGESWQHDIQNMHVLGFSQGCVYFDTSATSVTMSQFYCQNGGNPTIDLRSVATSPTKSGSVITVTADPTGWKKSMVVKLLAFEPDYFNGDYVLLSTTTTTMSVQASSTDPLPTFTDSSGHAVFSANPAVCPAMYFRGKYNVTGLDVEHVYCQGEKLIELSYGDVNFTDVHLEAIYGQSSTFKYIHSGDNSSANVGTLQFINAGCLEGQLCYIGYNSSATSELTIGNIVTRDYFQQGATANTGLRYATKGTGAPDVIINTYNEILSNRAGVNTYPGNADNVSTYMTTKFSTTTRNGIASTSQLVLGSSLQSGTTSWSGVLNIATSTGNSILNFARSNTGTWMKYGFGGALNNFESNAAFNFTSNSNDASNKFAALTFGHYDQVTQGTVCGVVGSNVSGANNISLGGVSAGSNCKAATSLSLFTAADSITALGTERLKITSAGLVGIGTTTPYAPLSVVGSGGVVAEKFTATSSTATSTFTGIVANCFSTNGTTCITGSGGSSASSTLLSDNNTWTGGNVFGNATSTNFFATTASSSQSYTSGLSVGTTSTTAKITIGTGDGNQFLIAQRTGSTRFGMSFAGAQVNFESSSAFVFSPNINNGENKTSTIGFNGYNGVTDGPTCFQIGANTSLTSEINWGGIGQTWLCKPVMTQKFFTATTSTSTVGTLAGTIGSTGNWTLGSGAEGTERLTVKGNVFTHGTETASSFTATSTTADSVFPRSTGTNSTTTNATSTNFFSTTASSTNLYAGRGVSISTTSQQAAITAQVVGGQEALFLGRTGSASNLSVTFEGSRTNLKSPSGFFNMSNSFSVNQIKQGLITVGNYDDVTYAPRCFGGAQDTGVFGPVFIGGGFTECLAATSISLYTSENASSTVGSLAMRILGSGNVGIGASVPTTKLFVVGTTTSESFVATSTVSTSTLPLLSSTILSASTICLTADTCRTTWPGAGSSSWSTTSADYWLTQSQGAAFSTTSADAWDATKSRWATTSANWNFGVNLSATTTLPNLNVLSGLATVGSSTGTTTFLGGTIFNGNVGIGTSSPTAVLNIKQVNDTSGVIINGSTVPTSYLKLYNDVTGYSNIDSSIGFRLRQAGTNIAFISTDATTDGFRMYDDMPISFGTTLGTRYFTGRDNTSGNFRLSYGGAISDASKVKFTVDSSGNVGIGTTTPSAPLEVWGNLRLGASANSAGLTASNLSGTDIFSLTRQSGGATGDLSISAFGGIGLTGNRTGSANPATSAYSLYVANSGNVGIGTTSPYAKLSVTNTGTGPSFVVEDSASADGTPFIIDASGNVGIGTTTPAYKLDVYGDSIRIGGGGSMIVNTDGNSLLVGTGANTAAAVSVSAGRAFVGYDGSNAYVQGGSGKGLNFNVNSATSGSGTVGTFTSAGNLGIGTSTPSTKLSIEDSVAPALVLSNTDTNIGSGGVGETIGRLDFWTKDGSYSAGGIAGRLDVTDENLGSAAAMRFFTAAQGTFSEKMRISSAGNVGIGTTTPGAKLVVQGDSASNNTAYLAQFNNTSDANGYLRITNNYANVAGLSPRIDGYYAGGTQSGLTLYASTNNTVSTVTEPVMGFKIANIAAGATQPAFQWSEGSSVRMTIDKGGNIGIGTTSPLAKLDVLNTAGGSTALFSIASSTNGAATSTAFYVAANGNVGVGTTSPSGKFATQGTVFMNGLTTSTAGNAICQLTGGQIVNAGNTTCVTSSARFKTDIKDIDVGLKTVLAMKPRSYTRKEPTPSMPSGKEVGLIAEEVNKIEPRLVEYEPDGVTPRGVNYQEYTAILTKAIQEQQAQIDELKDMKQGRTPSTIPVVLSVFLAGFGGILLGKFTGKIRK